MIRVCFLIRSLAEGGAERQLVELVTGLDPRRFDISVLTFYQGGRFAEDLGRLKHVRYVSIGKKRRWQVVSFVWRLLKELRNTKPHVLHSYLGTANVLAALLKPFIGGARVVWGMRASDMDLRHYDRFSQVQYRVERALARFADLIVSNSRAGRDYHVANGFPEDKVIVIPNGIDIDRFQPDPQARAKIRSEWGIADNEKVVGVVGRLDPMKDHETFLRAAAELARVQADVRFVCVGDGPAEYRSSLRTLSGSLGLGERVIWAGSRGDMPAVYNAFDIMTSSSAFGEGFSNAVGEAMASGVPCVVTKVGDSAWIVSDSGIAVEPRDPSALAQGWRKMMARLEQESEEAGSKARARAVSTFAASRLTAETAAVLERLVVAKEPA